MLSGAVVMCMQRTMHNLCCLWNADFSGGYKIKAVTQMMQQELVLLIASLLLKSQIGIDCTSYSKQD